MTLIADRLAVHPGLVATMVTVHRVALFTELSARGGRVLSEHPGQAAHHRTFSATGRLKQTTTNQGPCNRRIAFINPWIVPKGRCSMTLTPWDMFVIQTAIDRYEKAFPDKPSPSLAEALEWNAKRSGQDSRSNRRQNLWSRASEAILTWWQTSARRSVG
jgi:hypothetical protein